MEHIIASQIMKHLEDQNILSDNQFGFRSKYYCETQLLITINDIAKDIDRNLQVDAAIPDFFKAFNKVAHSRLPSLYKLNYYGSYKRNCLTMVRVLPSWSYPTGCSRRL